MRDSIAASSHGDPAAPMEGPMPFSLIVFDGRTETYWAPWSLRWAHPEPSAALTQSESGPGSQPSFPATAA